MAGRDVAVLAGVDHRYGWSQVPVWLVLVGNAVVLGAFLFIFRVYQENRYAASTVEVEAEQQVISTGLYGLVRHPMYLGALLMFLAIPLALGSYWAYFIYSLLPIGLVLRLLNEEKLLLRELPGYADYRRQVRWRLIPGVW